MAWARFDDAFPTNLKIRKLTDAEFRLDVSAICWSNAHGSDGVIATDDLPFISDVKQPARAAAGLVAKGRWRPILDGWEIHDFLEYNLSAAEVEKRRDARVQAGQRGGRKSVQQRRHLKAIGEADA